MKAVLLVRVSTQGQDYEAQTNDLVQYANTLGFHQLHIIQDKESGVKLTEEERNGLNAMKEYLTANQDCKTVFIWEISRLARTEKVLHSIKEWLVSRGIQLHIFDKRLSLLQRDGQEDPNTALIFSILGSFASQEAKQIKARFTRGKAHNKEMGKYNGGVEKYGYTHDVNGFFIPNEAEAEVVRLVYELYATGQYSQSQLTKELKARGYNIYLRKVTKILQETCYIGTGEIKYPPIISLEIYEKCKAIRSANYSEQSRTNQIAFARKLMKCPCCGYNYSTRLNKLGYTYFCINNVARNQPILQKDNITRCTNKIHLNRDLLDAVIWHFVKPLHYAFLSNLTKADELRIRGEIDIIIQKERTVDASAEKHMMRQKRIVSGWIDGLITDEEKAQKLAQVKALQDESKHEKIRLQEERIKLTRVLRKLTGDDSSPMHDIKANLSLENMAEIIKQHIKQIDLERTEDDKYTVVKITPITGEPFNYFLRKAAKVGKIHIPNEDGNLTCIDDELRIATEDYWKLREKEDN